MKKILALVIATVLVGAFGAQAAAIYKINNSNNLNLLTSWSTTSGAQTPNPGALTTSDIAYFNEATMLGDKTVSLGGDLTLGGIGLDWAVANTANSLIINAGNTLTLNGGTISGTGVSGGAGYTTAGIVLNRGTGGTLTINCNVAIGAAQQWVTSRALTVGGTISLGANTLSFNTAGAANVMTLSGVISGTGGLNKTAGAGTLALSNTANTFGGQVTLVGGTTSITKLATISNNSSLGTGNVASSIILNGAVLAYTGAGGDTTDRAIDMRAGAAINNNSATGTISFTAANVIQGGTASVRNLTLGGTNTGANTFGSIYGDSGANSNTLTKNGVGTWVITGVNTYTGYTAISAGGVLRVTGSGVLGGKTGSVADANNIYFTGTEANSALEFETAANLGVADQIRFRTTGGGPGILRYIGTTSQTVSKAIQCDTSFGLRLESNSVGGKMVVNGSFASVAGNRPVYLGGTGTGDNELASSITANGTGTLTKDGAGKWILSGANTYSGGTTITAGTLSLGSSGALGTSGTITMNGGTLQFSASNTTDYTSGSRLKINDGTTATLDTNGQTVALGSAFALGAGGTGGLTKSGAGTLEISSTAANTYTGATSVNNGTLRLDGSVTSAVTVAAGAKLQGTGIITKAGTALSVLGTLAPGNSIGTLTVNGDVSLSGTSDFEINQDSTTADLLLVQGTNGALTYGGILNVTTLGSGLYTPNQTFNLFDFTSQSGTFSSVSLPSLSGQPGYSWDTSALYTAGTITVIPEPATVGLIGLFGAMALLRRRMKITK